MTTVKIPASWLRGDEGDLVQLQAWLASRGQTVLQRQRGGQWVRLRLAETLNPTQQTNLAAAIASRLNAVQFE